MHMSQSDETYAAITNKEKKKNVGVDVDIKWKREKLVFRVRNRY